MGNYKVPYTFIQGFKASAVEVNACFDYVTAALDGIQASKTPFCVNSGNYNNYGEPDLFYEENGMLHAKVGKPYADLTITTGNNHSTVLRSLKPVEIAPTAYKSVIPEMTAPDYPEGSLVKASSEMDEQHLAWRACDNKSSTTWCTAAGVVAATLTVTLDAPHTIKYYTVANDSAVSASSTWPSTWVLQGSNDGSSWTALSTITKNDNKIGMIPVDVEGSFQIFRLNITANNGASYTQIGEFDLFIQDPTGTHFAEESRKIYVGPDGMTTLKNQIFRRVKRPSGQDLYNPLIPKMTSNIVPNGYITSASNVSGENYAFKAADGTGTSFWLASQNLENNWWQVQLPAPKVAKVCKVQLRPQSSGISQAIAYGKLLGSNDGENWSPLYEFEHIHWTDVSEVQYFYFQDNTDAYTHYRLLGSAPFSSMAEFQIYEAAPGGSELLGEAEINDVWFNMNEPYVAQQYVGNGNWIEFEQVLAGSLKLNEFGSVEELTTEVYNQNGLNVNALTTKSNSGNILTKDAFLLNINDTGYYIIELAENKRLIIQWGYSVGWNTVLFPIAFPNRVFSVVSTAVTTDSTIVSTVSNPTNTGFYLKNGIYSTKPEDKGGIRNNWIAIGW